tara:strand:- start:158 stop:391 length:234 start_codon:yes stop_codon:yes gene_type:complete
MPKLLEEKKDPVQLELSFPGPIQFKDCIAKISRKHGSRGSVLQQLLGDVCQDKPIFFGDWVLAQQEKESEEQGEHNE